MVGQLAVLLVTIHHADEFLAEIDLGRVGFLRPAPHLDGRGAKALAQEIREFLQLFWLHGGPSSRVRRKRQDFACPVNCEGRALPAQPELSSIVWSITRAGSAQPA